MKLPVDPTLAELRLGLSALPAGDRCAMLHALGFIFVRLRDRHEWQTLRNEACAGMSAPDKEAMVARATRIATNFRPEWAAAAA